MRGQDTQKGPLASTRGPYLVDLGSEQRAEAGRAVLHDPDVLARTDGDRGDATVELIVSDDDAAAVSAAAADDRTTVMALADEP